MHRITTTLLGLFTLVTTLTHAAELKYIVATNFFEANPGGQAIGSCHGSALIDKAGNIYITTDTERGILVFDDKGKFVRAFGPSHVHGAELRKEKGVEYIYGARPAHHEVVKFKLDGTQEWSIQCPMEAGIFKEPKNFNPCAVTVGPDGSIFVADGYGSNYVLKFDKNRKFIKAFGGPGDKEGTFKTCHGIALDTRGKKPLLFVCNRNINRIEHWDLDGNFVETIQKDLRMPAAVQIRGKYAVIAELQGRVTVVDDKGIIVAQVGDNPDPKQRANNPLPPEQWKDGICNSPHGAALDKNFNIVVNEWSKYGHLHKFDLVK